MSDQDIKPIVIKFGGAALTDIEHVKAAAKIIVSHVVPNRSIIVVTSAMGQMTDELISLASSVHPSPPKRERDMLVSVGERISMSLLAMALDSMGYSAISFTGSQSGIITCDGHENARILDVRPMRVKQAFGKGSIVIIAGFQGVSHKKEITTLGRGGSDTSAVAIGIALGARKVYFYKDVDGVYDNDPNMHEDAQHITRLSYEEALSLVASTSRYVIHPRALELAFKNHITLCVRSFKEGTRRESVIEDHETKIEPTVPKYEENLLASP